MKTPKREREDIVPIDEPVYDCMGGICDIYSNWEPVHIAHARWKRKNRIAQLKRSLHRYKHGTMLDGQYDLYLAYRWLQRLQKPDADADSASWEYYRYNLRAIRGVIVFALQEAESAWQKAQERENRKEQK